ncbi:non-ribosomal peptide synthetase, partial [Streptomyces acidicola]|nr:amino acid adenylation domain-containing protein [Streptomyces acidicola]
ETVGRLWTRGTALSPTALPIEGAGRRRVPVPTYPFQRGRHWPGRQPGPAPAPAPAPAPSGTPAPVPSGMPEPQRLVWSDAPLTAAPGPRAVRLAGADSALGRALADRLTRRGVTVLGQHDASEPTAPDTVVWLAGTAADPATRSAITELRDVMPLLGAGPTRLLLVTEDVHTTGVQPERSRPEHALLHGFALALPEEHPGLSSRGIDLSSRDALDSRLDALERELHAQDVPGAGGTVAWRAGRRLTRTPVGVGVGTTTVKALPPDGTYLITGGAGGLGSALARDLAERGTPDIVLTGRTSTPPRDLLAELRARGARARYHAVDVCDEAAVDALVAGLPPLDYVFHAAGTARPGSLRGKPDAEIEDVLAAKVRGTALLAGALRRHGHDDAVCVAFSSVSSVLPGLAGALGDYAAAGAFLDAFAAAERAAGRPWQAIGFGPVADTGLASRMAGDMVSGVRARGLAPMTAHAALAGLYAAIGVDAAHVLVTGTANPTAGPAPTGSPATGTRDTTDRTSARPAPRPEGDPSHVADLVRHLLAEALHRAPEDIGDDEQFLTLGLDSLTAVDLARRLERELGRTLPATLLFEYRTLGELAAHLATGPQPTPTVSGFPGFSGYDPPADDGLPGPLTPLQLAFHTTEALHEGVTAYGYVRQSISGPLDSALLGRALSRLAARHPMLRLRITRDGDTRPRQYAVPAAPIDAAPSWYEVREPAAHQPYEPAELEQTLCNRPFDLTSQDPVRAVLVREHPHLSHLLLVVHHAAADGFSLKVLGEELWALYTALARGDDSAPELPSPQAQFADYAAAVAAERQSPAHARDQEYWRDRLAEHAGTVGAGATAPALPYDGDPEAPPAPPLAHHRTVVDETLTAALREVAARHGVSLFHLLLAVYGRCLARWSGQRAVAVNVARSRRELPLPGIDRLVGPLADTLPVFVTVGPDEPVTVLAQRLRRIWREAEAHATLSSPDIARLLPTAGRGPGPAPRTAAEAGFSFARFPVVHGADWPVTVTPTAAATATAATRLGLLCWEADASLRLSWNHPARLFRPETVRRLADAYVDELRAAVAEPQAAAQDSVDVTADDDGGGIVDRLCARLRATPEAVAVDTGRTTLTYAALDEASAALAARLRAHGVRHGDLVGLLTEPGADTVTGVVGILRSGAGWVPLDATHPAARHRDQVSRTGVRVLVCDATTRAAAAAAVPGEVTLVATDAPSPAPTAPGPTPDTVPEPAPGPAPGGQPTANPDSTAYVIFTSGSTGRPKAVPVTHRSMTAYLDWALSTFGYGPGDRLVQTASICFDASVRQVLAPLLAGATVHTLSRDLLRDPEALLDRVVEDRITVWSSVPTLWEGLLTAAENRVREDGPAPDLSALRWVHVGGEALPASHVRRWFDLLDATGNRGSGNRGSGNRGSGHRISNLYGPTEATINATCHIITTRPADDVRHLPIGRPIAGTELAVVDEDGRPCGPGEAGELLITGTGLTPGYLGDPELTAAAFTERDGRRWYRSGDRVRRGTDGVLEFLGRLDDQVKVRGHRVELGEVEAALLTHPGVARAAVLLRDGRLVAYVEPRAGTDEPDAREVRTFLSRVLPPYMLPAHVRSVPALPLTGTGKIDRNRLARPDDTTTTTTADADPTPRRGTPPATPTERLVAGVWCEVLEVPEVFQEDDFFTLGGDSMTVLELFARLRTACPALPRPTAIYTHRTLTALAAAVDAATATGPATDPAPVPPTTDTTPT